MRQIKALSKADSFWNSREEFLGTSHADRVKHLFLSFWIAVGYVRMDWHLPHNSQIRDSETVMRAYKPWTLVESRSFLMSKTLEQIAKVLSAACSRGKLKQVDRERDSPVLSRVHREVISRYRLGSFPRDCRVSVV